MRKIVGLASLYEPLEFLRNRIRNLLQCDLDNVTIFWVDCSSEKTWSEVSKVIEGECSFDYRLAHFVGRKTLYWTWNYIVERARADRDVEYACNVNVDDIYRPDYFRLMAAFLDARPDIQIVACPWKVTECKGQVWLPVNVQFERSPDPERTLGHFPMWRLAVHEKAGVFDPRMVAIGDSDFWSRIRKLFGLEAMGIHPETLACFLSHDKNLYNVAKGPHGELGELWDRELMRQKGIEGA